MHRSQASGTKFCRRHVPWKTQTPALTSHHHTLASPVYCELWTAYCYHPFCLCHPLYVCTQQSTCKQANNEAIIKDAVSPFPISLVPHAGFGKHNSGTTTKNQQQKNWKRKESERSVWQTSMPILLHLSFSHATHTTASSNVLTLNVMHIWFFKQSELPPTHKFTFLPCFHLHMFTSKNAPCQANLKSIQPTNHKKLRPTL